MKVLVAGLGSIGQRHVRNLRTLYGDTVEILAFRARGLPHVITDGMTLDKSRTLASAYGVRTFDRLDEALAERPVAVFVCNPTSLHMGVALAAARAGCHLFIEKPLSHTMDGVAELIDLVQRRDLVATVGYQLRYHPAIRRLRELLCRREVGRVVSVQAEMGEYLPDAHPYEDYRTSYAARAALGGGAILCLIHEFDYVQWLFGPPRRIVTTGGRLGDLEIDVEDTAVSRLACTAHGDDVSVHVRQSFVQRPRRRTCIVTGTDGTIDVDLNEPRLTHRRADGEVVRDERFESFDRNRLFLDEVQHFVAAIRGGDAPPVTLGDAAASLRTALAARASLATGRAVELS